MKTTKPDLLRGAFVALTTPFNADETLDHSGLAANINWMLAQGLNGVLLLGSTGEQPHLNEFERALVFEIGRRQIPSDRLLIAGTGMASTRATVEETRLAAQSGADVALVVTPSYYQKAMTADALTAYYRAIADASPIPILLYSVPPITNVTIPPAVVAALASHENVIGMKNSSSDAQLAAQYRDAAKGHEFIMLSGSAHAAPGLLLTNLVDGVILGAANLLPEVTTELIRASAQADAAAVQKAGNLLHRASATVGRYGIAGWKAGLNERGQVGGIVRAPLRNLTPDEREQVSTWTQNLIEAA